MEALTHRIEVLEARPIPEPPKAEAPPAPAVAVTFESAMRLYDTGRFEEAVEAFRSLVKKTPRGKDKRARFWLGESLYSAKDYASAAIELQEFKKRYPNDVLVAKATFRQAMAFKSLKKSREARLFFQELIDHFPKDPMAAKAKNEMKSLKD